MLRRDPSAIFILRGIVGNRPFMLAIYHSNLAPLRLNFLPRRAKVCRISSRRRTPSVVVSVKIKCVSLPCLQACHKTVSNVPWTILLHLHRHTERIQRAFLRIADPSHSQRPVDSNRRELASSR